MPVHILKMSTLLNIKAISKIVSTRCGRLTPPNLPLARGGAAGGGVFSFQEISELLAKRIPPTRSAFTEQARVQA
jgi:hypothetical protein